MRRVLSVRTSLAKSLASKMQSQVSCLQWATGESEYKNDANNGTSKIAIQGFQGSKKDWWIYSCLKQKTHILLQKAVYILQGPEVRPANTRMLNPCGFG